MAINHELIRNLVDSAATNAAVDIVQAVRVLGQKYDLGLELQQEIGALICDHRERAVKATIETTELALKDALRGIKLL